MVEQGATYRLRRAFGLGSVQAGVRLLCSFISIKLTAVYLGPSGLALIAQFNNLVSLAQGLAASAPNTAIVRLTPEYKDQPARRQALWASSARVATMLALPLVAALLVFAPGIATRAFGSEGRVYAVWLCALSVLVVALNGLLLSVFNGLADIQRVVQSNVLATVAGLLVFAPACMWGGLQGGFIGSMLAYGVALGITLVLVRGQADFQLKHLLGPASSDATQRIWSFFPMLLAHATLTPLSTMWVRDTIMNSVDLQSAGLWQAAWRLSETYITVITTSVSLYFMPRLGELSQQPQALRAEVWRTLGVVVLATAAIALVIGLLRHWVVLLVFSSSFSGVEALMPVQLFGDVLRMAAWTLGFVLVAQVRTRWYIGTEVLVPACLMVMVLLLIPKLGVVGANWAYVVASALHLALGLVALRSLLFSRVSP